MKLGAMSHEQRMLLSVHSAKLKARLKLTLKRSNGMQRIYWIFTLGASLLTSPSGSGR